MLGHSSRPCPCPKYCFFVPLPATFAELQAGGGLMLYLPRVGWRADHSLQKLREVGFDDIVPVEGLDGATEDPWAIGAQRGLHFDVGLTGGEVACALSMIALWERVVDEALPYLLVFEDDVLPHPDIERLGTQYWAETPRDADFVFLGNQMDVDNVADSRCRVLASPSWCLHAYVISDEGARRALSLLRTQMEFDDRWLSAVDIEARTWMERGDIRYVCWNGTMLPKPFPVSDGPRTGVDLGPDVMRPKADTGLFYQNFSLGSAIWPQHAAANGGRRLRKPRAVLIAPTAPHRGGNGLAMRAGVALEGLARTCDVALVVAPYGYGTVSSWAKETAERILVLSDAHADPFLRRIPHVSSSERDLARLAYPRPFASTWSTPAGAAAIVELVSGQADLVYVTRSYLAPLAEPWLAGDQRTPLVLDVDEDDSQALRQLADVWRLEGNDPVAAQLMAADADKLELIANQWIPRADLALASSDVEVAALRTRFADLPARALPNPVPVRGAEGWAEPVDVAFVANFDYLPNQDAARWLCRQVLPRLRRRMGREVRVALAGSHIGPAVAELNGDGVVLVRDPWTVTPIYEATTIAVAPLRAGGGTRIKILEAFGHRRAVVSTSLGAEGLPVTSGKHLLIADSADDFADACGRALWDWSLRAALVSAAVEVAIAHSWPRVASMVSEIATEVLVSRRGGAGASPAITPPTCR